ncbi:MAG: carboxypeptidase regulatory-like domain-containing protein, partial [Polaromonas sp.]|nr:carboxypeptidase regulatory-like domain-containing protein [Gemmatimonadaceae bacterium]
MPLTEFHIARQLVVVLAGLAAQLSPFLARAQATLPSGTAIVTGVVRNGATSAPVRLAVVRQAGGIASTLSNDLGRYRIELPLGAQRLDVRRIGFRPASISVVVPAAGIAADVALDPIAVGLERVLVTAHDDAARRIIAAAIRRKQVSRGLVHDYHYDGDVRLVVRDLNKPADSASSIRTITQTRTSAYWEQPNHYQETIVARRQTGNLAPEQNLVGVGQIVNFSRDRVAVGRFELASPVADDALDRYEFRLLDTLAVEGRRVFRLSLEPLSKGTADFTGVIDVADSTFDVTGIDVGVNAAVRLGFAHNVRYQQRFGAMDAGRWMPRAIELSVDIVLPVGNIQLRIQQTAELSGYR